MEFAREYDRIYFETNIYTGRGTKSSDKGLGHDVCVEPMEPFFNCGHHLFDNNFFFFTSVALGQTLLENGTYLTGTMRQNRKDVPDIVKVKQKKKKEEI